ncbi:unnamed protein product [Schistosoma rodhaini]|uniref:Ovule protein n=1 Tax=Schistosoma rodhaini TaxID=6188 RepID=A0A183QEX9_9TREM|nr:unnamed protein product [Schistosoma rodhaini]
MLSKEICTRLAVSSIRVIVSKEKSTQFILAIPIIFVKNHLKWNSCQLVSNVPHCLDLSGDNCISMHGD